MSESKANLESTANRLRKQIAAAEAQLDILRGKLAKAEAQIKGQPAPPTGLDLLWQEAIPISRTRSSKFQCRQEWNRIPVGERPTVAEALAALKIWKKCDEWKMDSNAYVPALHRWIKNRQWENLPEAFRPDPSGRYRNTPKPLPQATDPSEEVTDLDEIRELLGLKK